jgi:hypothetical protein
MSCECRHCREEERRRDRSDRSDRSDAMSAVLRPNMNGDVFPERSTSRAVAQYQEHFGRLGIQAQMARLQLDIDAYINSVWALGEQPRENWLLEPHLSLTLRLQNVSKFNTHSWVPAPTFATLAIHRESLEVPRHFRRDKYLNPLDPERYRDQQIVIPQQPWLQFQQEYMQIPYDPLDMQADFMLNLCGSPITTDRIANGGITHQKLTMSVQKHRGDPKMTPMYSLTDYPIAQTYKARIR